MAFQEQFQDPNVHDQLTEHFYLLKQIWSVREYTANFESLACKTNQPSSTWGNIFYWSLKDNIKNLLVEILCRKSDYQQLKQAVLEADKR